jgi:hypothetical protein
MQPLPAADRHLRLLGEHGQREPPSEPGAALIAPAPGRRGSFDIGRNQSFTDSFPPFPTFPGLPSPGFCLEGNVGNAGNVSGGHQHWDS